MENTPANCRHHSTSLAVNRYIRLAELTFALLDPNNYGMPQIHSGLCNGFEKAPSLVSEMLEELFLLQSHGLHGLSLKLNLMFGEAAFVSCLLCVQSTAKALKPNFCAARQLIQQKPWRKQVYPTTNVPSKLQGCLTVVFPLALAPESQSRKVS